MKIFSKKVLTNSPGGGIIMASGNATQTERRLYYEGSVCCWCCWSVAVCDGVAGCVWYGGQRSRGGQWRIGGYRLQVQRMGTLKSKSGLRKQSAIFFKKGIDRPRFMLYNEGTVEEAVGNGGGWA